MFSTLVVDELPPVDEILGHLRVRDIMTTDVVTVRPSLPVVDLLEMLVERHIGGVPVVGDDDVPIGVVSATDILRLATFSLDVAGESPRDDGAPARPTFFLEDCAVHRLRGVSVQRSALDGWVVADIMTPMTFTVAPDASLPELSRLLFRSQIHRALVAHDHRLLGIVTSFDVVRAVAAARED